MNGERNMDAIILGSNVVSLPIFSLSFSNTRLFGWWGSITSLFSRRRLELLLALLMTLWYETFGGLVPSLPPPNVLWKFLVSFCRNLKQANHVQTFENLKNSSKTCCPLKVHRNSPSKIGLYNISKYDTCVFITLRIYLPLI